MHRYLLILMLWAWTSDSVSANDTPEIAILPFTPTAPRLIVKDKGMELAEYLQGKLADFPDVGWVDRQNLKAILSESQYGTAASPIAMGRLAKADILICGRLDPTKVNAEPLSYDSSLTIEIIDLSNASLLAGETMKWHANHGTLEEFDNLVLTELSAKTRQLLKTALAKREADAARFAVAPLFFTNFGASPRLDLWSEKLRSDLQKATLEKPGLQLLEFPGAARASAEAQLALLGLTEADPSAWQKAARAYIWGGYRELPVDATTAFDDIPVEAELYLWAGDQSSPRRFSRRFTVKEFSTASQSLTREVAEAVAAIPSDSATPEAGATIVKNLFERLSELIGTDLFSSQNPNPEFFARMGDRDAYSKAILKLPYGERKLSYSRQVLQLACFFDPENTRWQLLRILLQNPGPTWPLNPDEKMAVVAETVQQLDRLAREPDMDILLFSNVTNFLMNRLVLKIDLTGWLRPYASDDPTPMKERYTNETRLLDPSLARERTDLLTQFESFLPRGTGLMLEKCDTLGENFPKGRALAADWLGVFLKSDTQAEARLAFLTTVWPFIDQRKREDIMRHGPGHSTYEDGTSMSNAGEGFDRLLQDSTDRSRVQAALALPPRPVPSRQASGPSEKKPSAPSPDRPPRPVVKPLLSESFLSDVRPVPAPPATEITGDLFANARQYLNNAYDDPFRRVNPRLKGYGTQMVVDFSIGLDQAESATVERLLTPVLYDASSGAGIPMKGARIGTVDLSNTKLIYRFEDRLSWMDLATMASGTFEFADGLPVANPPMIGLGGSSLAYVGGIMKGEPTVGIFDWKQHKWLSPLPPSQLKTAASVPSWWRSHTAPASKEWLLFPAWSQLFNSKEQRWIPLDPLLPQAAPKGFEGGFEHKGYFWMWDSGHLVQYSPRENRIIWQVRVPRRLEDVTIDGPYLWLVIGPDIENSKATITRASNDNLSSSLVLMDVDTHEVIGAIEAPFRLTSLYLGPQAAFLTTLAKDLSRGNPYGLLQARLLRMEKEDLYAALKKQAPILPMSGDQTSTENLYEAIARGNVSAVQEQLNAGASPDQPFGPQQVTALMTAIEMGNIQVVQALLAHKPDLEARAQRAYPLTRPIQLGSSVRSQRELSASYTALSVAARQKDPRFVDLLLQAGAKPDGADSILAPLAEAIRFHRSETAFRLLSAGASIEALNPANAAAQADIADLVKQNQQSSFSALNVSHEVIERAREATARQLAPLIGRPDAITLLEQTKDRQIAHALLKVDRLTPIQREKLAILASDTPLGIADQPAGDPLALAMMAVEQNNESQAVEMIKLLPEATVNSPGGRKLFLKIVQATFIQAAAAMLAQGADPSTPSRQNVRARADTDYLWAALSQKRPSVELVSLLLGKGADPHLSDRGMLSMAEYSLRTTDSPELLTSFLKAYPDFLQQKVGYGTLGGSLLCSAIRHRQNRSITLLLDLGVSPSTLGRQGYSPLHAALAFNNYAAACLLLGKGADLGTRDLVGREVFDPSYLDEGGFQFLAKSLERLKTSSEAEEKGRLILLDKLRNFPTQSELLSAIANKDLKTVQELIQRHPIRWPASFTSQPGVIFAAVQAREPKILQALLEYGFDPNIPKSGRAMNTGNSRLDFDIPVVSYRNIEETPMLPLSLAAQMGDLENVSLLLKHGAYAPAQDQARRSAIDLAATPEIARFIEEHTQDQFAADSLAHAIKADWRSRMTEPTDLVMVKRLAKETPEVFQAKDPRGVTVMGALEDDWYNQREDVLKILSEHKIPLNGLDEAGLTALHRAVLSADYFKIEKYLKLGFDPRTPDTRGVTAQDLANTLLNPQEKQAILALFQKSHD